MINNKTSDCPKSEKDFINNTCAIESPAFSVLFTYIGLSVINYEKCLIRLARGKTGRGDERHRGNADLTRLSRSG